MNERELPADGRRRVLAAVESHRRNYYAAPLPAVGWKSTDDKESNQGLTLNGLYMTHVYALGRL